MHGPQKSYILLLNGISIHKWESTVKTYLLNFTVSPIEDRNTQFEGCRYHWTSVTYRKPEVKHF